MPFTPFHFGPSATVALPLKKYLDLPVFVLANVVIDIEPLIVMMFDLPYRIHGFSHTLLGGIFVGTLWGIFAYLLRSPMTKIMNAFCLKYVPSWRKMIVSGVAGMWFHVFIDSFMHQDIRPFYPLSSNPFYQAISTPDLYTICTVLFVPALISYMIEVRKYNK